MSVLVRRNIDRYIYQLLWKQDAAMARPIGMTLYSSRRKVFLKAVAGVDSQLFGFGEKVKYSEKHIYLLENL